MDDTTSWDEVLNSEPTETPAPEAPPPADADRPRDEHGRFVSASDPGDENPEPAEKPATEAAPPAAQQDADPGRVPVESLRDERQKRQQLEQQLQQYEAYFSQLQQQPQPQPQAEVPDMYADPQGYTQWIASQVRDHIMQEVQQYGGQFETNNLVKVSELMARQRHEDYDAKVEVFKQAAAENPLLIDQLRQAPDPAMYAYQVAGKYLEAKQYGTAAPSRDDLKTEIRAELMAELSLSPKPTAPSSLASQGSLSVPRSGPAWSGPADLGDILNQR